MSAKRRLKAPIRQAVKRPDRPVTRQRGPAWVGMQALRASVVLGVFGVPSVMWIGLRNPFGPPKALVLALAAALALGGFALAPAARAAVAGCIRRSHLAWAAAALCGVAVLSALTAVDVRQSLLGGYPDYRGLLSLLAYAAVGVAGLGVWRLDGGASWLLRAAVVCSAWVGGVGVLQRIGALPAGPRGEFGSGWRVGSTLGNSSNLGVFLVVVLPLVVWVALKDERPIWRMTAWAGLAMSSLSLLWTLSRGAWLAAILAATAALALLAWERRSVNRRVGLAIVSVLLVAVVGAAMTPSVARRASMLIDSDSGTAKWRLSTWQSSASMALARPFLGFGPNQFRFAYPTFQAPGQIDGRTGYPVVEAAHNLEADTATSFGLLGLAALIACGILAGITVFRSIALRREDAFLAAALGLGVACGAVALQFHYVTMDTGPPLAVLLAGLVWIEARQRAGAAPEAGAEKAGARSAAGWSLAAGALVYLCAAVMAAGLIGADRAEARAATLAAAKAPWSAVRAELSRAEALAPWEAQIIRARGTVATAILGRRFDSAVALEGIEAFDAAVAMTPADAVLASERGNLMLAAGLTARDTGLLRRAISAFSDAERMDPNTGIAMAGHASALLALGRTTEAISLFERALLLSPRYGEGWRNLTLAYRTAGRSTDARHANERAQKWSRRP